MTRPLVGTAVRAAGAVAGASFLGVTAHNARIVLRMRARSDDHDHPLQHDTVLAGGPSGREGVADAPLRLDVLGDSSASGYGLGDPDLAWPRQLAARLRDRLDVAVAVRCVAVRGARIRHIRELQVPQLERPDVVAISVGANDVLGRRLPHLVRRDTAAMLDAVRAVAPQALVVLGGPGALGKAPSLPWPLNRLLTWHAGTVARHQEIAARSRDVPFGVLPPLPRDHFGPDGFHAGAPAHALAAEMTVEALRPQLEDLAGRFGGSVVSPRGA